MIVMNSCQVNASVGFKLERDFLSEIDCDKL